MQNMESSRADSCGGLCTQRGIQTLAEGWNLRRNCCETSQSMLRIRGTSSILQLLQCTGLVG